MKTKLMSLFVVLLMGLVELGVASCSSGDDDGGSNSELIGTWRYDDSAGYVLCTFNSNGKGTLTEVDYEYGVDEESFTYTYNASSKILTMLWEFSDDLEELRVLYLTSTKLVVSDEDGETITLIKQ